jgi:hypothetical protein
LKSVYSKRKKKKKILKKLKMWEMGGIEEEMNGMADERKMIYVIFINCNWLATRWQ